MSTIEQSIDVHVPVRTAYDQWTQFETFPQFMEGVERIEQRTATSTHWVTRVGGVTREFDATITEQVPDSRVAWASVDGPRQAGAVSFEPLSDEATRIVLSMDFEPEGVVERAGDALGIVERRVQGDLARFKSFIEERGAQTGGWRGEVHGGTAAPGAGASSMSAWTADPETGDRPPV